MIIGRISDTLFDVRFVLRYALLPRRFQKLSVFSIWRRSDRCDTRTAKAFVSRETIVSVTLNMLISLLKRLIPTAPKKAKRILYGGI